MAPRHLFSGVTRHWAHRPQALALVAGASGRLSKLLARGRKRRRIRRISVAAMVTGCNEGDVKEFGIFKFCGRLRELSLESFFVLFGDSTELAAKCDRHKQQAGLRKEVDYDKRLTTKKLRLNVEEDD